MKIGLVVHPYGEKKPAGLARAVFELAKNIIENDQANEYIIFLKQESSALPNISGSNWSIHPLNIKHFWMTTKFRRIKNLDFCIFFTPVMPLFFSPENSIIVAHDFAYLSQESLGIKGKINSFLIRTIHALSFQKAIKIITISQYTKQELLKNFKVPEDKIKVILNGFTRLRLDESSTFPNLPEHYFLFAGVIKKRKNVERIIRAFCRFKKSASKYKLLIVGKEGGKYYEELIKIVEQEGRKKDVIFTGFVTDEQLFYLYHNAHAFVFPSLIEGFGMPVLEAMDCGTPVLTSNAGSLAEVAGDAALCVDPYDISAIANGMVRLSQDSAFCEELKQKGRERSEMFSWEKTAQKYIQLINALDKEKK